MYVSRQARQCTLPRTFISNLSCEFAVQSVKTVNLNYMYIPSMAVMFTDATVWVSNLAGSVHYAG
jgi:hypothetical protein